METTPNTRSQEVSSEEDQLALLYQQWANRLTLYVKNSFPCFNKQDSEDVVHDFFCLLSRRGLGVLGGLPPTEASLLRHIRRSAITMVRATQAKKRGGDQIFESIDRPGAFEKLAADMPDTEMVESYVVVSQLIIHDVRPQCGEKEQIILDAILEAAPEVLSPVDIAEGLSFENRLRMTPSVNSKIYRDKGEWEALLHEISRVRSRLQAVLREAFPNRFDIDCGQHSRTRA
tara:strand:+ start:1139 stop:1831 length:693 start_codon:yes stop_codon:yes gene_type:complete